MQPIELEKLYTILETSPFKENVMSIEQIHGFLCAIIAHPSLIPINQCLAAIYGDDSSLMKHPDAAKINEIIETLYSNINQAFHKQEEIKPLIFSEHQLIDFQKANNALIISWCAGYMAGVSANQEKWLSSGHEDIRYLLTPISAFAQFFDNNQPQNTQGNDINIESICQSYLHLLPITITQIFQFWQKHQHCSHHHHIDPIRHEQPKIGRNDPCICGSGKKFKKCCNA
ncbi:MAG: hypothetical protein LEGION0398_MBIBDBAK_00010 [Legionellaceae bacterium]